MGIQYSKATAVVNSLMSTSLSAVQDTKKDTEIFDTQIQDLDMSCLPKFVIGGITQKIDARINVSNFMSALSQVKVDVDEQTMAKAISDAMSKGGLGAQGAVSQATVNAYKDVRVAIQNSISDVLKKRTIIEQHIRCGTSNPQNPSELLYGGITQEIFLQDVVSDILKSESVTDTAIKLRDDLEASATASATGYDPMGLVLLALLGLLAAGAIVGLPTFMALKGSTDLLKKRGFWITILTCLAAIDGYFVAAPIAQTWPYRPGLTCQADDDAKKRDTGLKAAGGILAGLGTIDAALILSYALKHNKSS